jgi:hypothetical protein
MTKPTTSEQSSGQSEIRLLAALPKRLRDELLNGFKEITTNFREGRWEPSMLNGGKLCEVIYTIIRGYADGTYPARAAKPKNMAEACKAMESAPATLPRSIRIQIPRMLVALYEIRNNRSVGHVGGDVDPNHMDAIAVLYMSKWLLAELVRFFHNMTPEEATAQVETIVEREIPVIWRVRDRRRVLAHKLSQKEKTLLLLYGESTPVTEKELIIWIEARHATSYRSDVLRPLHRAKLIEYDEVARTVTLSPLGTREVEEKLPLKVG